MPATMPAILMEAPGGLLVMWSFSAFAECEQAGEGYDHER
jgi:hypothetical protein